MNASHFFIVIEGLDGSGKSETARRLAHALRQTIADRVLHTFEPHDPSAAGSFIRAVLTREIVTTPRALALAYALNRADHLARVVDPFLEGTTDDAERVVVCDRYLLSSLVYQVSDEMTIEEVFALNKGARTPDLTLFLDADPETCYARMGERGGDRELFESGLADQRARYLASIEVLRARGEAVAVVDANGGRQTVFKAVTMAIRQEASAWLQQALDALQEPDKASASQIYKPKRQSAAHPSVGHPGFRVNKPASATALPGAPCFQSAGRQADDKHKRSNRKQSA